MEKQFIVEALGEGGLTRPSLLNAGLAANDRAKFYFALLQLACAHADGRDSSTATLRHERQHVHIEDEQLDGVIQGTTRDGSGAYVIPHAERILAALFDDVRGMTAALDPAPRSEAEARLTALRARILPSRSGRVHASAMDALASADRQHDDSLHLLVMDLHRQLNALQVELAAEVIEGAYAYGLREDDRPHVRSFMQGVGRTAALKFDHPGLGTTVTRDGNRLVIQNDIGLTDAHVLVVHVAGLECTVTYTDVHLQRLLFFQSLFDGGGWRWEDMRSRRDAGVEGGLYHLTTGVHVATEPAGLNDCLAFLGSRLVFLIDWNKARKRLRVLVPNAQAIGLLGWAAQSDIGHMAFLRCGADALVLEALDAAASTRAHRGRLLTDILGVDAAMAYLRDVLRICKDASIAQQPRAFISDDVRGHLVKYLRTGHEQFFDLLSDHATIAVEIAGGLRDALLGLGLAGGRTEFARRAEQAKAWESAADKLLAEIRRLAEVDDIGRFFRELCELADDVADALEDATFHLSAVPPPTPDQEFPGDLVGLADTVLASCQEHVRLIEIARDVHLRGPAEDLPELLGAVHRIGTLEHHADDGQRGLKRLLLASRLGAAELYVMMTVIHRLEHAADRLMHCALRMRDHVLAGVAHR